jgi:hypothetical protein
MCTRFGCDDNDPTLPLNPFIAFRGPTYLSATPFSLFLSLSLSLCVCFNLLWSKIKIKMVQLTISAAPKYTARGLPLTIDVTPEATVGDVKAAVAANFSKVCNVSLVGTGPGGLDAPTRGCFMAKSPPLPICLLSVRSLLIILSFPLLHRS